MSNTDDTLNVDTMSDIDKVTKKEDLHELDILKYPNSKLKLVSNEVTDFTVNRAKFLKNLLYTMKVHGAISISAPSVNIFERIVLINVNEPLVMFNPVLISNDTEHVDLEEGLISIPGFFYNTKRYTKINIAYQDVSGERLEVSATGMLAATIQHELDIINGRTYLNNMSIIKRYFQEKKIKKHLK